LNLILARADSALAYLRHALQLWQQTGNRRGDGITLQNLGSVHRDLGRPDSALSYYHQALTIYRETGERTNKAATLSEVGDIHLGLGQPDSALAHYSQALAIQRDIGHRVNEGVTLLKIANSHRDAGRPDTALEYYNVALLIARETGDRPNEGAALHNVGDLYRRIGQADSALAYYQRALSIIRETGHRADEAIALADAGRLYLHDTVRRDAARAVAYFDSAAGVYASIRRHAGGDANAISMAEEENARRMYHEWALAWLARPNAIGEGTGARAALAAAERGRAQALLDLLRRKAEEARDVAAISERVTRPGNLAAEADSLLAPLSASRTAALSYLVTDDTLLTWIISPAGEVRVNRVPLQPDELAALVTTLRAVFGADAARGRMAQASGNAMFEQEATTRVVTDKSAGRPDGAGAVRRLAELLLPADLEQLLSGASELVVIPHGLLSLVPFAALPVGAGAGPLGSRYPLRYAPSFAALAAVERKPAAAVAVRSGSTDELLVVGDPAMPWVRSETGDSIRLRQLTEARTETSWIAARLGATPLIGPQASETAVRRRLPAARVVHFATHGLAFASEARVRSSYIAFAADSLNDGLLTMAELLDDPTATLAADLVVLSACQTGLGDLKQAEGTVGLQRAFLARGARSVLVSLWSVDDEATRLLMQSFYTHWLAESPRISKAEALRRAQQDVRTTSGFEHPRYWAAFQMVGAR
jgi:CHAT domain-containing protein/tetratricopeptide (TPR) repeat protein